MQFLKNILLSQIDCCESTTRLIEKRAMKPLTFSERYKIRKHFVVCKACKAYEKQSHLIDVAIAKWFDNNQDQKLSAEVKAAIIKKVTAP
jgi:hypothetical protein